MPLQYIIDAYNTINHITFTSIRKKTKDPQRALLNFLSSRRSGRTSKNKITVVFDGYPKASTQKLEETGIDIVFSKEETADARINRMVETSKSPGNIVVVSDDREIQFFIKSAGARSTGVEEFINPQVRPQRKEEDTIKPELNYSQISKINQELKELWLKD